MATSAATCKMRSPLVIYVSYNPGLPIAAPSTAGRLMLCQEAGRAGRQRPHAKTPHVPSEAALRSTNHYGEG